MEQYIVALITAIIGGLGIAFRQYLQTKLKPQQFNTVVGFATEVVNAAQQAGDKMGWDGSQKYEYAQTSLETLAKRVGVTLKPEESNAIIHAAVKAMKDVAKFQQDSTDATFQRGVEYGVNQLLSSIGFDGVSDGETAPMADQPLPVIDGAPSPLTVVGDVPTMGTIEDSP
jgi:hypothetical protein